MAFDRRHSYIFWEIENIIHRRDINIIKIKETSLHLKTNNYLSMELYECWLISSFFVILDMCPLILIHVAIQNNQRILYIKGNKELKIN